MLAILKDLVPYDFSEYKISTIYRRIKRRAALRGVDFRQYVDYAKINDEELKLLAKDFLISVTGFFRDEQAFASLEEEVIPKIITNANSGIIKVWVAGCATGEEAYSIAMLFDELLQKYDSDCEVKIFATDIDEIVLKAASKGSYSSLIQHQVSAQRLEKYFTSEGTTYTIKPRIRGMVIFANHDIVRNPPYCNLDLISCRNLLIYLNPGLQKKVFNLLHFGLKLNGYLLLGSSENIPASMTEFKELNQTAKIYQNTTTKRVAGFDLFATPSYEQRPQVANIEKTTKGGLPSGIYNGLSNLLVNEIGGAGLLIDINKNVLQSYGAITEFLHGKLFTLHLPDLFPEESRKVFNAALHKACMTNRKVFVKEFRLNDRPACSLSVQPIMAASESRETVVLVLFRQKKKSPDATKALSFKEREHISEYVKNLELEVQNLKLQLHLSIEQNNSSSENLQSFNEELLSANEEMQSSNEEWQSVNEELQTINAAYQQKIQELTELNDDLNNYFRSNINGQIFVDNNLLLKKFSPNATEHINVRPVDIGRPLNEITANIKFDNLISDIRAVVASGELISREVQTENGLWFQVLTMPYIRHADNERDGVIVSFYNISKLKKIEKDLDDKNQSLKRINADLDNFVYTASHDLIAPLSNLEGLIELLQAKLQSGSTNFTDVTEMVKTSLQRFKLTIRDLAEIGKIESEMLKEPDRINFADLLDDIKYSIHDQVQLHDAQIIAQFSEAEIRFSKRNLRSIMYNLIGNAVKFAAPDRRPEVFVNTYKVPGFIVLMVKDNGIGIDQDKLNMIFKMYHKLENKKAGQGLGLYLVKKITEASGGKVEVESTIGEGTVFKVYLPFDSLIRN